MTNEQRRAIINDAKSRGYQGSYVDLFRQAALNPSQNMQVAQGTEQQREGLRPMHEAGRTDASMAFKDVPPNTPFNTVGMKAPIDIKKYDTQGHLVKSYENVPPGLTNLDTGPNYGTVIETPTRMQEGGPAEPQMGDPGVEPPDNHAMMMRNVPYEDRDQGWYEDFIGYNLLDDAGGRAADIANKAQYEVGGEGDSYRHALAAAYSVNALQKKGVPSHLAVLGVNALGLAHEIITPGNTLRENAEDIFNNFAGSLVGAFQDDKGAEATTKEMARRVLPDGLPQEYKDRRSPRYRKKAQRGTVVDYLLPALDATNPVDFSQQQAASQQDVVNKFEGDLAAEKQNVQRVRENIIPTAKRIAEGWENLSGEDERAYENILNYNPAPAGTTPEVKPLGPLRDQMRNRPEGLKEIMPNYNLHLAAPDKYGSQRGIYCTTMGCFAYEEAGARQITDSEGRPIRGNEVFVRETAEGVTGFEEVPAGERQPGDMTVITGRSKRNYNKPHSPENTVIRPHHTVIYSGEAERPTDLGNMGRTALDMIMGREIPARDYDYNNPGAIRAYSAETGDMHKFQETVRSNELPSDSDRESFRFYRYVGNVPQYTRGLADAKYNQSQADKVAAALQQNADMKAQMEPERPETPDIQRLEGKQAAPIENDIPERDIVKTDKKETKKPKAKLTEKIANKVKGKAYDLKDRRKSKQPKEPSKRAQRRARVKAVKADYKSRLQKLKDSQ